MSYSDHLARSGVRGEFGSAASVRPGPRHSSPTHCRRGHRLEVAGARSGWSHIYDLPLLGCDVCQELTPREAAWAQFDPDPARQVLAGAREAETGGLRLVVHSPSVRGGVGRIALHLQRDVLGDIDLALCGPCRVGVIEHVRDTAMTPEQRLARRRVSGLIRVGSAVLSDAGLEIWREQGAEEWKAGPEEIVADLHALGVQPILADPAPRPSYRSSATCPLLGTLITVPPDQLPTLATNLPSATAAALTRALTLS